jgi:hypothetical protein
MLLKRYKITVRGESVRAIGQFIIIIIIIIIGGAVLSP